jgi:prefoldin subunit 5
MSTEELHYLTSAIRDMNEKLDTLSQDVQQVKTAVALLQSDVKVVAALDVRVREVEQIIQQAKGAKWTLGMVIAGAAFLGGGIGAKIIGLFTTK